MNAEGNRHPPVAPAEGWDAALGDNRGPSHARRSGQPAEGSAGGSHNGEPEAGAARYGGTPGQPPPPKRAEGTNPQGPTDLGPRARHIDLSRGAEALYWSETWDMALECVVQARRADNPEYYDLDVRKGANIRQIYLRPAPPREAGPAGGDARTSVPASLLGGEGFVGPPTPAGAAVEAPGMPPGLGDGAAAESPAEARAPSAGEARTEER